MLPAPKNPSHALISKKHHRANAAQTKKNDVVAGVLFFQNKNPPNRNAAIPVGMWAYKSKLKEI